MANLTTDELTELTALVNERLEEFNAGLPLLSLGTIRLAIGVIEEWSSRCAQDKLREQHDAPDNGWQLITRDKQLLNGAPPSQPALNAVNVSGQALVAGIDTAQIVAPPQTFGVNLVPEPKMAPARRKQARSHEKPVGKRGHVLPSLTDLIAEVQRLSMGTGDMPTMMTFNAARPGNWATAHAQIMRHNVSWNELAEMAELRPRLRERQPEEEN